MKLFDKQHSVYSKYMASYIILLCIPMIFFWIMYSIFVDNVEKEGEITHAYKIKQVISHVDDCIKDVIDKSSIVSSSELLLKNSSEIDGYERYLVQKELKEIISKENLFYEAGVYYKDSNWVLTSSSEYEQSDFYNRFFSQEKSPQEIMTQLLSSTEKIRITSMLNDNKEEIPLVTILVKNPFLEKNANGVLFFMIKKQEFDELLSDVFSGYTNENILFIDDNNQLQYSESEPDGDVFEYVKSGAWKDVRQDEIKVYERGIGKNPYILSCRESSYLDISYLILMPKEAYFNNVYEMRNIVVFLFPLILVIGVIAIYLIMRMNYNPIKTVYERAAKWIGNDEDVNELNVINKSFDFFQQKEKQLIEEVSASQSSKRNELLLKLLRTEINQEDFLKEADSLELDFRNQYYRVITIGIHHKILTGYSRSDVEIWLKNNFSRFFEGLYVDIYDNENFAFVVNSQDDAVLLHGLQLLQEELAQQFGLGCCIGVGRNYYDINDIKKSSMESATAIQYSYVYGKNKIIEFVKLDIEEGYNIIDISKELEVLKTLFIGRDAEVSTKQIRLIINKIKKSHAPIVTIKRAVLEIVYATSEWIHESMAYSNAGRGQEDETGSLAYLSMDAIISADTLDSVEELLINVCTYLCDENQREKKQEDANENLRERMLTYINQTCYDANFSIKQMAADFDMAQPYLSQRFKVMTGQTISAYVNKKRIEKAKELLITTDTLVKDIILEIGYYDVSSFLRKFKQSEGITPGAYREKYQKK